MFRLLRSALISLFLIPLVVSTAAAQSDRGRVVGTIDDLSGAVVPHANISIINQATSAIREVTGTAFGRLSSTVGRYVDMGTARQIQFAVRYRF